MTTPRPNATSLIGGAFSANRRQTRDYESQHAASPILLSPGDVSGGYDASRLLLTTLGGKPRLITEKDLKAFQRNATALGKHFKGGITAQGIVDHSLPADRQRARREIHFAVPARDKGDEIIFATNAGPDSEVSRHFVTLKLEGFGAAVASPILPGKAADLLARGKVRIDCDCPHWRFVYRYIATVGRYNATIAEWGFPKITNPRLKGCACKHVLRVAVALNEGQVRSYIAKMVERSRQTVRRQAHVASEASALGVVEAQSHRKSPISLTPARSRTSGESRLRALARQVIEGNPSLSKASTAKAQASIGMLLGIGAISKKQANLLLQKIQK